MKEQEPKNEVEPKLIQSGPVFESGPGWGAKTKKWLNKYFYRVVLPIIVIALLVYGFKNRPKSNREIGLSPSPKITASQNVISQEVRKGDSRTLIARRALADYLQTATDVTLSAGQKVFVENKLSQLLANSALKVASNVEIKIDDIQAAITESQRLTKFQLQKWEEFAKKVKF